MAAAVLCFCQCTALNRPVSLDPEEKNASLSPDIPQQQPAATRNLPKGGAPLEPENETLPQNSPAQNRAPEPLHPSEETGDAAPEAETVVQETAADVSRRDVNAAMQRKYREERFRLSRDLDDYATEVIYMQGERDGKVALLMGGAHGNEPGGYLALLEFARLYRPRNGILVILPLQNPLALKNGTRSSMGPILNNYYNFSRAFPAKKELPERDEWIWSQFRGVNDTWWWYDGDQELVEQGVISPSSKKARTLEGLLDEEGYRRALDPDIKAAAKNVYKLMLGEFPDGTKRYDQIDLLLDLHEAAWFYQDVLCVDDPESEAVLKDLLPDINSRLQERGLDPVSACLSPLPTGPGWTARYELPRPALAVTTETNRRLPLEIRLRAQAVLLEAFLLHMGFELERTAESAEKDPAG